MTEGEHQSNLVRNRSIILRTLEKSKDRSWPRTPHFHSIRPYPRVNIQCKYRAPLFANDTDKRKRARDSPFWSELLRAFDAWSTLSSILALPNRTMVSETKASHFLESKMLTESSLRDRIARLYHRMICRLHVGAEKALNLPSEAVTDVMAAAFWQQASQHESIHSTFCLVLILRVRYF